MIDVVTTDKEVKITVEMPGVSKDKIKIDAYESTLDVKSEDPQRKYHKTIDLPLEADVETASQDTIMACSAGRLGGLYGHPSAAQNPTSLGGASPILSSGSHIGSGSSTL